MTDPLREPTFLILAALAPQPLHGYAIIGEVADLSGGRLALRPGTLYGALDRLADEGLLESDREEVVNGRMRRYYRLTDAGAAVLERRPPGSSTTRTPPGGGCRAARPQAERVTAALAAGLSRRRAAPIESIACTGRPDRPVARRAVAGPRPQPRVQAAAGGVTGPARCARSSRRSGTRPCRTPGSCSISRRTSSSDSFW